MRNELEASSRSFVGMFLGCSWNGNKGSRHSTRLWSTCSNYAWTAQNIWHMYFCLFVSLQFEEIRSDLQDCHLQNSERLRRRDCVFEKHFSRNLFQSNNSSRHRIQYFGRFFCGIRNLKTDLEEQTWSQMCMQFFLKSGTVVYPPWFLEGWSILEVADFSWGCTSCITSASSQTGNGIFMMLQGGLLAL